MAMKYSRADIVVGIPISLILLIGFSATAWYYITHDIRELKTSARFIGIWFSLMMALMGLSGLLRFASLKVPWLSTVASLIWCGWVSLFGLGFILLDMFFKDSIAGGIPLLPSSINQTMGSILFIAIGLVILVLIPKLFRHQQRHG